MNTNIKVTPENIDELYGNCSLDSLYYSSYTSKLNKVTEYQTLEEFKEIFYTSNSTFYKKISYDETIVEIAVRGESNEFDYYEININGITDIIEDTHKVQIVFETKSNGDIDVIDINKKYVVRILKTYKESEWS